MTCMGLQLSHLVGWKLCDAVRFIICRGVFSASNITSFPFVLKGVLVDSDIFFEEPA